MSARQRRAVACSCRAGTCDLGELGEEGTRAAKRRQGNGDDSIAVSECDAGLEIVDEVSGDRCIVPGMDFRALMRALSEKAFRQEEFYGDAPDNPESESLPPTLSALHQEMRTKVATYLSGWDTMALACTSRAFCNDLSEDALLAGFDMIRAEGLEGVKQALTLLNELPASYRLEPLQTLAEAVEFMATKVRTNAFTTGRSVADIRFAQTFEAFEALREAAYDLMPEARAELFGSLAYAAQWLDVPQREAAWLNCVAEIEKANVDPYGKHSAAVNLIGSYARCLTTPEDRRDYFDRFLSMIAGRESSDAGKGYALAKLVDSIAGLAAADRSPAFDAVEKLIVELDNGNQGKGSALCSLARLAARGPDLASHEQFKTMADLVLELPPTDPSRTLALYEIASQMSHTALFGSDMPRFAAIVGAVADLDDSDRDGVNVLLRLMPCIGHLPVEDQGPAREMIKLAAPSWSILSV